MSVEPPIVLVADPINIRLGFYNPNLFPLNITGTNTFPWGFEIFRGDELHYRFAPITGQVLTTFSIAPLSMYMVHLVYDPELNDTTISQNGNACSLPRMPSGFYHIRGYFLATGPTRFEASQIIQVTLGPSIRDVFVLWMYYACLLAFVFVWLNVRQKKKVKPTLVHPKVDDW